MAFFRLDASREMAKVIQGMQPRFPAALFSKALRTSTPVETIAPMTNPRGASTP